MKTAEHSGTRPAPNRRGLLGCIVAGVLTAAIALAPHAPLALAGGPLASGGSLGVAGQPFRWDTSAGPIPYRTDGGRLGYLSNSQADGRVASLFQIWQDVPESTIAFALAGSVLGVADGDIDTLNELDAVSGSCNAGQQSPIVYDADGSLFASLFGPYAGVIGFAGSCNLGPDGSILTAWANLNGSFIDGSSGNLELSSDEFDGAILHEFGHFIGLDHSQVNLNCLVGLPRCPSGGDDASGLPTMFPWLLAGLTDAAGLSETRSLSVDDKAWVSALYPDATFPAGYGTVSGRVFFSDGSIPVQGANVIARRLNDGIPGNGDESRSGAVSVVTGYLHTGNRGQTVTGTNAGGDPFGSRDPLLAGYYELPLPAGTWTIEVESVFSGFRYGSRVGPLSPPIPLPGALESWDIFESSRDNTLDATAVLVLPGAIVTGLDIVLNGTPPVYDIFESDLPP